MASQTVRITLRIILAITLILFLFYVGRPLYWKISATVHDIRNNRQTVQQGFSEIVREAQKTVGWYHDESDSGVHLHVDGRAAHRRILRRVFPMK